MRLIDAGQSRTAGTIFPAPSWASILTVNQMPVMGDSTRVEVREYPGGHMFYSRAASQAELHKDVQSMFTKH